MATWAAYAALTSFFRRISCRDDAEGSTDTADAIFLFVDGFRNEPTSTDVRTPIEGVVLCSMRAGVEATDGSSIKPGFILVRAAMFVTHKEFRV